MIEDFIKNDQDFEIDSLEQDSKLWSQHLGDPSEQTNISDGLLHTGVKPPGQVTIPSEHCGIICWNLVIDFELLLFAIASELLKSPI